MATGISRSNNQSSSNSSEDLEESEEYVCKTHLIYEQGGVAQKFTINNTYSQQFIVPGRLFITENKFGHYIEWKCEDSPKNPIRDAKTKSVPEWATTQTKIGFNTKEEGSVELISDPRTVEFRRPIKIELAEIGSLLTPSKSRKGHELILILRDGTSNNPFIFEREKVEDFISALERIVSINIARDNKDLRLITPKKSNIVTPQQTIAELFLPDQVNNIFGLIRDVKNDPMAVAKTGLAKLADYTATQLNSYAEQQRSPVHVQKSSSSTQLVTSKENSGNNGNNDLEADYATNEEGYEVIFRPEKIKIDLGQRSKTYRGQALNQEQWLNYLDNEGRLTNLEDIKKIVFRGGVESPIRKHVWVHILGVYEPHCTFLEREEKYREMKASYEVLRIQWSTITPEQEERFHLYRDFKSLIEKDVARTDRCLDFFSGSNNEWTEVLRRILISYVMYNFNVGYVQGMSDILAPLLMEVQDEVLTFFIFVKFMERIHSNFEMSQESMQSQLKNSYILLQLLDPKLSAYLEACDASNMYFAFRWLLILFKREFSTDDTMTLWEALWTDLPGPNFHLFIGLAILEQHRSTIMNNRFGLSEILRHVNDLSMRIDLNETMCLGEGMYLQLLDSAPKLPDEIRSILHLPLLENENNSLKNSKSRGLINDEPISSTEGDIVLTESILVSPSPEEQSLDLRCDIGMSQFL